MNIRPIILLSIGALAAAFLVINLFTKPSADYRDLPSAIEVYTTKGIIPTGRKDSVLELYATTDRSRLLVGYSFYNLLFDANRAFKGTRFSAIGVNEKYSPQWINIYFISPNTDPFSLLKRYSIYNARSFPETGLIIVNTDFIKGLLRQEPVLRKETKDFLLGLRNPKNGPLPQPETPNGIEPWGLQESFITQALYVCIYVVVHEIGHVYDFETKGGDLYAKTPPQQREMEADQFFASLFVGLLTVPEFKNEALSAHHMATLGMLTYMLRQLLEMVGKNEAAVYASEQNYTLKNSVFASHPPMAHRLMQVLYYIFKEENKGRPEDDQLAEEGVYRKLLDHVKLRRSWLP